MVKIPMDFIDSFASLSTLLTNLSFWSLDKFNIQGIIPELWNLNIYTSNCFLISIYLYFEESGYMSRVVF
jgi:Fe2+ transport system protein B